VLGHCSEQVGGARERSGGPGRIARDDKHLAEPGCLEPREDPPQVAIVEHEARGQVGDDLVPVTGQALREVEGRLESLRRRYGDGDLHVSGDVGKELVLDALERDHLVPWVSQKSRQGATAAQRHGISAAASSASRGNPSSGSSS
jgi:hypothetical protein